MIGNCQQWTIVNESGERPIRFTSFFDLAYSGGGKALSYPLEEGAFANYNKAQNPGSLKVTLGMQGSEADFDEALRSLNFYQKAAEKLRIVTPAAYYDNYTLESYGYQRAVNSGAGMLVVELALVEVKEVETRTTTTVITKPRNPTSSGRANRGRTQTSEADEDVCVCPS